MLMVLEDEAAHAAEKPRAIAELIEKRAAFVDEARRRGVLRDTGQLRLSREGKRVRRTSGRLEIDDGPFTEDGKALGAYYVVETSGIDEAARLAAECPGLAADEVDVRPVMKGRVVGGKNDKRGKLFACAVLGNAATEDAWVDVMDRIDADTRSCFPPDSFLGGVRLEPPKSGRRVVTRGERRATFDGPFLESKEVIGGLFILRMASMHDAVRWAGETPFMAHGTLEIRELWRT